MPVRQGQAYDTNRKKRILCLLAALRCAKRSGKVRSLAPSLSKALRLGVLAFSFIPHQIAAADNTAQLTIPGLAVSAHEVAAGALAGDTQRAVAAPLKRANFGREQKSRDAQRVADWVVDSGDNRGLPFVIVDKRDAKVFVFYPDGRLRGAAPALLGLARGDGSIPGIGERKLSQIRPEERTTPAGRFVASLGYNFKGKDVLWVDYDTSVSMHRVITNKASERRLQRLATPTPLDNRISYGCINVPVKFFNNVLTPAFTGTSGIVYVLPEIRSNREIFAMYYDVDRRWESGATVVLNQGSTAGRQE